MRDRERHRASISCYLVLASSVPFLNVEASLAQELSVEERACIISAVAKLPQAARAAFVRAVCIAPRAVAVELFPPFHHVAPAPVFLDQLTD